MFAVDLFAAEMVRHYHRKSTKGSASPDLVKAAVLAVIGGVQYMTAAKQYGIDRMTLKRHVKLYRSNPDASHKAQYNHSQVFNEIDEASLADYLVQASKLHYGLSTTMTRKLAYQFAVANHRRMPKSWSDNETAGTDWLCGFMSRNLQLSLRSPEATSLARATAFNRHNVEMFFNNLAEVRHRHQYGPEDIYNVDETGLVTVQKPKKVIASKGVRQVGRMTSAERGTLVTACCAVNAIGNALPPFFVFPRVNFYEYMLTGGPVGSVGVANVSGWMTADNFLVWMKHFVHHTKCSVEHPVLLVLDNHESHVSVACLDLAKQNGVTMLTFPPHCSHKLQPLDRSVFGPLKKYYNASCDSWLMSNTRPMTIYDIPSVANDPYSQAFTSKNIKAGFAVSGIEPFNQNIFSDDEFLPSSVTDRPAPPLASSQEHSEIRQSVNAPEALSSSADPNTTSPEPAGGTNVNSVSCSTPTVIVTPEDILPFPKAPPRKNTSRRQQKTRILTDTPVRQELRERENGRKRKLTGKSKSISVSENNKKNQSRKRKVDIDNSSNKDKNRDAKRKSKLRRRQQNVSAMESDSSDEELSAKKQLFGPGDINDDEVLPMDDRENMNAWERAKADSDSADDVEPDSSCVDSDNDDCAAVNIKPDDFVIVQLKGLTHVFHSMCQVSKKLENDLEVRYLNYQSKRSANCAPTFTFPVADKLCHVPMVDFVRRLPKPIILGGTKRVARKAMFEVPLNEYNFTMV